MKFSNGVIYCFFFFQVEAIWRDVFQGGQKYFVQVCKFQVVRVAAYVAKNGLNSSFGVSAYRRRQLSKKSPQESFRPHHTDGIRYEMSENTKITHWSDGNIFLWNWNTLKAADSWTAWKCDWLCPVYFGVKMTSLWNDLGMTTTRLVKTEEIKSEADSTERKKWTLIGSSYMLSQHPWKWKLEFLQKKSVTFLYVFWKKSSFGSFPKLSPKYSTKLCLT